jgi:hypothetical protein
MDRPRSVRRGSDRARVAVFTLMLGAAVLPIRSAGAAPADPKKPAPQTDAAKAPPPSKERLIFMWDHIIDSNDETFEDFWAFTTYKQTHYQVWYGEFTKGAEAGGYVRDHRRSTYAGLYRYRKDFDHVVQFDTEQILKHGFVAAAMLRGIHVIPDNSPDDQNMLQVGVGTDYYYGNYNFVSFRAINDPRESGRWSFITSNRFQRDPTFWIQPGIILRTDNSTGWFLQGKYKYLLWGAGSYDRFDFTDVDRTIYSLGIELSY